MNNPNMYEKPKDNKCILHEFASHSLGNCSEFKKLNNAEKMDLL